MEKSVSIGIVGCGLISDMLLAGCAEAGIKITAVCDVDQAKAARSAQPFGAAVYSGYETMQKEADLAGIIIALPNFMHYDAAVKALAAGKHVFCEKPMITNADDSRALVEKAWSAGRIFQVGHMKRFHSILSRVKSLLDQIAPVTVARFSLVICADPALRRKAGSPATWHADVTKSGGGFLVHSGSHLLDLMMHYFGTPESAWGSQPGRADGRRTACAIMDWIRKGSLDLERIVARRIHLEQLPGAFESIRQRRDINVVVTFPPC